MSKKPKPPATVDEILAECTKAVIKGLGKKRAGRKAAAFWITHATPNIEKQVKAGTNWYQARKRVLPTAKKMGRVAAVLTGDFKVVPEWAAEASAAAVKLDPKCPGGPGAGGFCP